MKNPISPNPMLLLLFCYCFLTGNHSLALEAYGKADKMLEGLRDEELSMVISEGRKFSNSKLSAG